MTNREEALESAERLWAVAQRDTHQSRHIAHFVMGLFNGRDYPFDLSRLMCLDERLLLDCMKVLEWSSMKSSWINDFMDRPNSDFVALAAEHGIRPVELRD